MSKIVYIVDGMASSLHSSLEWSRRLRERGHEVTYLGFEPAEKIVKAHGFGWVELKEDRRIQKLFTDLRHNFALAEFGEQLRQFPSLLRAGLAWRRQSLRMDEVQQELTKIGPDLLLIDIENHAIILMCSRLGIPILLPTVFFSLFRAAGLPPLHLDLRPALNEAGERQIEKEWKRLLQQRRLAQFREEWGWQSWRRRFRPISIKTYHRGDLKAVAKFNEIDFLRETDRCQWVKPHLYRHYKVVCFNVWEMELPHQKPDGIEYVGPMIQRERKDVAIEPAEKQHWRLFEKGVRAKGLKLVYASLGTFWAADQELLRSIITVFKKQQDWALVLGLGGRLDRAELGLFPVNVLAMNYAPQVEVLQKADAAITHGGATTINECLDAGVPMLVCSTGKVDQDGNAIRIEHHGVGRLLREGHRKSEDILRELKTVLTDQDIRERVKSMQGVLRRYEERGDAVELVERVLKETKAH